MKRLKSLFLVIIFSFFLISQGKYHLPKTLVINQQIFEVGDKLGEGQYGSVFELKTKKSSKGLLKIFSSSSSKTVASNWVVKIFNNSYETMSSYTREVLTTNFLELLQIPTIKTYWDEQQAVIIKERVNGPSLHELLQSQQFFQNDPRLQELKIFIQKLVHAPYYIGDLHDENIMYDSELGWVVVDASFEYFKKYKNLGEALNYNLRHFRQNWQTPHKHSLGNFLDNITVEDENDQLAPVESDEASRISCQIEKTLFSENAGDFLPNLQDNVIVILKEFQQAKKLKSKK